MKRGGDLMLKFLRAGLAAFLVAASAFALAGCDREGAQPRGEAKPPKSDFERNLDTVRRGRYVKIYVIRRADGQPLRPEDRQYLRDIKPMKTGMWVVTEDATTALAGAGFEFEPELLADLAKRFTVEDYTNK